MKQALIVGIAGQDGFYLTNLLLRKSYAVFGVDRLISSLPYEQRKALSGVAEIDLLQTGALAKYVAETKPDEIYYLAAHHFSSQDGENRSGMMSPFLAVNLIALNEVLEVVHTTLPECRLFYAASAHIFGTPDICPQNEATPHRPDTPYSISKSAAVLICRFYREVHNIYTVTGILYNHESPRRPASFVTTQIARAAARAAHGNDEPLVLRDLQAMVDWGAAEDYVEAMWLTLQQTVGNEYIISSGVPRTVMDFANEAFAVLGLQAEKFVFQQPGSLKCDRVPYIGDNSRINRICGWRPTKTFESLVLEMVQYQVTLCNK